MKLAAAAGFAGLLILALGPLCRSEETITITLDASQEKTAGQPAPKKNVTKKPGAQSAVVTPEQVIGRLGVVSFGVGRIRAARVDSARLYYECPAGTYLAITAELGGWYGVLMVDGRIGWVRKERVSLLDYQLVRETEPARNGLGRKVVQTALKHLGIPYRWGGTSQVGIDCSGFVRMVFMTNGVKLPRTAREQVLVGKTVKPEAIQPGDRLYFCCKGKYVDHTGIYIGNSLFVHSSGSRGGVAVDSVFKKNYFNSLVAIRRP